MEKKVKWSKKDERIWKNVIYLTTDRGWTMAELGRNAGILPQTIQKIKNQYRGIGPLLQKKFADAFGFSDENILLQDLTSIPSKKYGPIPVISWVQAGMFERCSDLWPPGVSGESEPVMTSKPVSGNSFALIIHGDSMAPRFMEGDIIIVDPQAYCNSGALCVVKLNDEITFKKVHESESEFRLVPLNDKYGEQVINKSSRADFRIIGKVVDMVPKLPG